MHLRTWLGVLPAPYDRAAGITFKSQAMLQECEVCKARTPYVVGHILGLCRKARAFRATHCGCEVASTKREVWDLYKKPRAVLKFLRAVNEDHKKKNPGRRFLRGL